MIKKNYGTNMKYDFQTITFLEYPSTFRDLIFILKKIILLYKVV